MEGAEVLSRSGREYLFRRQPKKGLRALAMMSAAAVLPCYRRCKNERNRRS